MSMHHCYFIPKDIYIKYIIFYLTFYILLILFSLMVMVMVISIVGMFFYSTYLIILLKNSVICKIYSYI